MERLAEDPKYAGKVNFVLINCQGVSNAQVYAETHDLKVCPHGSGHVPHEYGVRYIPHKALIGKDGNVIKNYEGFAWSDIDDAMADTPEPPPTLERTASAEAIASTFAKFDANGDGMIDRQELSDVFRGLQPRRWSDRALNAMFSKADADGNGRLDYAEFAAWICREDSGRIRRALGLASSGIDGGTPQCANMCGRAPFRHHPTCCTHCKGADGPHARSCREPSSAGKTCRNGCGRKPFGDYATCCTHCRGEDGPHAPSCEATGDADVAPSPEPEGTDEPCKDVALSKILGEFLVKGNGTKVPTNVALGRCTLVGILFTAMW